MAYVTRGLSAENKLLFTPKVDRAIYTALVLDGPKADDVVSMLIV